jgi:GTP-binding protein
MYIQQSIEPETGRPDAATGFRFPAMGIHLRVRAIPCWFGHLLYMVQLARYFAAILAAPHAWPSGQEHRVKKRKRMTDLPVPKLTARQIEEGQGALFKHPAEFIFGTQSTGKWPRTMFPEIAFVGRSNVGKSSLLNALTGQAKLAKVSKTPGRTQQFNFFNLADRFMLVDMPGYGYASVGKQLEKMWAEMADEYFKTREQLRRLFLLIDSRHGIKDSDRMLMDWLNRLAVPYQVVLTKVDKTKPAEIGRDATRPCPTSYARMPPPPQR